jgi:hypothetical protein
MSENQNIRTDVDPEVLAKVADVTFKSGVDPEASYEVAVDVEEQAWDIVNYLWEYLDAKNPGAAPDQESIHKALVILTKLQVLNINGGRLPVPARHVPVPDFYFPFLSRIQHLDDPMRALELHIIAGPTLGGHEPGEGTQDAEVSTEDWSSVKRILNRLRALGVRFTEGLPLQRTTTDDSLFRVYRSSEGGLFVAGPEVGSVTLLMRAVIRCTFLSEVFGAARTRYAGVSSLDSALMTIVNLGIQS